MDRSEDFIKYLAYMAVYRQIARLRDTYAEEDILHNLAIPLAFESEGVCIDVQSLVDNLLKEIQQGFYKDAMQTEYAEYLKRYS